MKKRSKRYKKLQNLNNNYKFKNLEDTIGEIKKISNTKFTDSIDISFKINLKKIKMQRTV